MKQISFFRLFALILLCGLAACSTFKDEDLERDYPDINDKIYKHGRVTGEEGLVIFGGSDKSSSGGEAVGIGVNSFLWRASLDTISFMPLTSADPFGGVIITDWYTPPETPSARTKMTIYILTRDLRADGVRVSVFRQEQNGQGAWVDANVAEGTATKIEDAILTRARQLRIQAQPAK